MLETTHNGETFSLDLPGGDCIIFYQGRGSFENVKHNYGLTLTMAAYNDRPDTSVCVDV